MRKASAYFAVKKSLLQGNYPKVYLNVGHLNGMPFEQFCARATPEESLTSFEHLVIAKAREFPAAVAAVVLHTVIANVNVCTRF